MCGKHATLYRTHVHQCTCSTPKCQTIGLPFHVDSEVFNECVHHSAERITKDQIPTALAKRKKMPVVATPPDSPPMPHLEPMTIPSDPLRPSGSSGAISTGTSLGELPVKMKELGGRAADPLFLSRIHNPNRIVNQCCVFATAHEVVNAHVTHAEPFLRENIAQHARVHRRAVRDLVRTAGRRNPLLIPRVHLLLRSEGILPGTRKPIVAIRVRVPGDRILRNENYYRAVSLFLGPRLLEVRFDILAWVPQPPLRIITKQWLIA